MDDDTRAVDERRYLQLARETDLTSQAIDFRDEHDNTPLHLAASRRSFQITRSLILRGADVNARNSVKLTPLHFAAKNQRIAIVALLIENGANPWLGDEFGIGPLTYIRNVDPSQFHYLCPIQWRPELHSEQLPSFRRLTRVLLALYINPACDWHGLPTEILHHVLNEVLKIHQRAHRDELVATYEQP